MKKLFLYSSLIVMFCAGLCFAGCNNKDNVDDNVDIDAEYVSCEDKFSQVDENGWKRSVTSEALPNLNTQGLECEAYDFSSISNKNFGGTSSQVGANANFGIDLDLKNGYVTLKFKNTDYSGFLKYVNYLYNTFGVNLDANMHLADDVSVLIKENSSENMMSFLFEAYFSRNGKTFKASIFYIQAGRNSLVTEGEMYVTLPLVLSGDFHAEDVDKKLGEVVETWPGWTHLDYADSPLYQYIPTIYSKYYEVAAVDGLQQIYVPNYTNKMQTFYEEELQKNGFFQSSFDECQTLKDVAKKSLGSVPEDASVWKLNLLEYRWYVAVYRNLSYMQISCCLEKITSRSESEMPWLTAGTQTFETYEDFCKGYNQFNKNNYIKNPIIKNDKAIGYAISSTGFGDSHTLSFKQTFTSQNMTFDEVWKIYDAISPYQFLRYQGGGAYCQFSGQQLSVGVPLAGTDKYFFYGRKNCPLALVPEIMYNYNIVENKLNARLEENAYSYSFVIDGTSYFIPKDFLKINGTTQDGRFLFEMTFVCEYDINKVDENSIDYTKAYKNFHPFDVTQNFLDSKLVAGKFDGQAVVFEKDENFITATVFDHENLEDCTKEVIEFSSKANRENFERTFMLNGDEKFYASTGARGLLSDNLQTSKIFALLPALYQMQIESNQKIVDFFESLKLSEFWQMDFIQKVCCPSSTVAWMENPRFEELHAAQEYIAQDETSGLDFAPYSNYPYWMSVGSVALMLFEDGSYALIDDFDNSKFTADGFSGNYVLKTEKFTTKMFQQILESLVV